MTRSHSGDALELRLKLVGARRHIEANDQPIALDERVAGERRLDLIARQDVEREAELLGQFVLPLLDEAARRDDQAAFKIAPDQQLLDQQPGHDRLAGAGIVREQEAQRLARKHLAIDGRDLVRQRLDLRRSDREVGVEQVGEPDAVRLGREAQQPAVGIKPIGPARLDKFKADLLAAIDEPLGRRGRRPERRR